MAHDVTKPLPGEVHRVYGTIVLSNGKFYVSRNNLETGEAAKVWVDRMKQIYPDHLDMLYFLTKDIKPDPKYKAYWGTL